MLKEYFGQCVSERLRAYKRLHYHNTIIFWVQDQIPPQCMEIRECRVKDPVTLRTWMLTSRRGIAQICTEQSTALLAQRAAHSIHPPSVCRGNPLIIPAQINNMHTRTHTPTHTEAYMYSTHMHTKHIY